MEWWQTVMILLAITIFGVFIGIILDYITLRYILKRDVSLLSILTLLFTPKKLEKDRIVAKQRNLLPPDLMAEIEHNRNIVSQPLGEKLLPLERQVWEVQQHKVDKLPVKLRDELQQVYIDIGLVNELVWLSAEFGRRSPDLYKNYKMLCKIIVERLDIVRETGQVIEAGEVHRENQERG